MLATRRRSRRLSHLLAVAAATVVALLGVDVASSADALAPAAAGDDWESIGPDSSGGLLATSGDRIAVGETGGAVYWTSDDDGASWSTFRSLDPSLRITGLSLDPVDPSHAVVSLFRPIDAGGGGGVVETRDNGLSWQWLIEWDGGSGNTAFQLATSADLSTLVVESQTGFHVSTDGGASWNDVDRTWESEMLVTGPGRMTLVGDDLYVVGVAPRNALWAIRDVAGPRPRTQLLLDRMTPKRGPARAVHQVAADGDRLYATLADAVLTSTNRGHSWKQVLELDETQPSTLRAFDGTVYLASMTTLSRSSDGGATWSNDDVPDYGDAQHLTDLVPLAARGARPAGILVSNYAVGVWTSVVPGEYELIGISGTELLNIGVAGQGGGQRLIATGGDQVYGTELPTGTITPESRRWDRVDHRDGMFRGQREIAFSPVDRDRVWIVTQAGTGVEVHRSDDAGVEWSQVLGGSGAAIIGTPTAVVADAADASTLYVVVYTFFDGLNSLWVTRDAGETWERVADSPVLTTLTVDPSDPQVIWGGSTSDRGLGLWRSADGGRSWEQRSEDATASIVVGDDGEVIAGGWTIQRSVDGGDSFTTVFESEHTLLRDVVQSPTDPARWYAAVSGWDESVVLTSADGGATWQPLGRTGGLSSTDAFCITMDDAGEFLFIGTRSGEAYRLAL